MTKLVRCSKDQLLLLINHQHTVHLEVFSITLLALITVQRALHLLAQAEVEECILPQVLGYQQVTVQDIHQPTAQEVLVIALHQTVIHQVQLIQILILTLLIVQAITELCITQQALVMILRQQSEKLKLEKKRMKKMKIKSENEELKRKLRYFELINLI